MVACPFQALCCVQPVENQRPFLLAASGPTIGSFDLKDGSLLAQWLPQKLNNEKYGNNIRDDVEGRPAKRQKLYEEAPAELRPEESEESIEIISERKKGERRWPKVESSTLPHVSHLVATSDAKTVIGVTTEDKAVIVFDVQMGGVLTERSRR